MERETKKEFQNLGRMVKKGFDHVDKRFQDVDKRFQGIDKSFQDVDKRFQGIDNRFEQARKDRKQIRQEMKDGFTHINARFDTLEKDIKSFVTHEEFEDLLSRVKYLETKLGVESGK